MKATKKLIGLLLVMCMIFSISAVWIVPSSAAAQDSQSAQETVQGSAVLHCFNWSYNSIKAALPDIAAAGYTAVQTSPVQAPKDYNASWTDTVNQWWKLYQPLGFSVANNNNSWLGTKAQLTSLCTEADNYGIKVIVDVVANHVANNGTDVPDDGSSGGTYNYVNSAVESQLKNSNYYHSDRRRTNENSRYNITRYHLGMPDLNTANSTVQDRVLSLLKECIDCGVDGFRFDAAKHIEVPTDSSDIASQFWPTVLSGASTYAQLKGLDEPFYYGEILGSAGPNFPISNYTTYMAVTDNETGDRALDKTFWTAASELADGTYFKGSSADKSVLWVESHDTYMGNSGSAYFSNTKSVTSEVLNRAWAIVGARADSTALFFARPNSTMGAASLDTNWKSDTVKEVNKFKNHFEGTPEYLAYSGNTAYIERGKKGVVISKLDGGGSVNLTANQMKNGTYKDQITNNTFTVANGKITGTVGSTGVAVVYNAEDSAFDYITASTLYLRPSPAWINSGGRYAMYFYNSISGASTWASMSSAGNNYFSGNVPAGDWTNVIFCRMDGSNNTNSWANKIDQTEDLSPETGTNLYNVSTDKWSVYGAAEPTSATTAPTSAPTEVTGDTYTVYAINNAGWNKVAIHYWGDGETSWPGVDMTPVSGTKVYSFNVPKNITGIVLTNGASSSTKQTANITEGIKDGATWTVNNTTDSEGKYTTDVFYFVGSMNGWTNNNDYAFSYSAINSNKPEFKLLGVQLTANASFKVHSSSDTWYPSGNDHTVSAAGTYDIYFRPNGDGPSSWLSDSKDTSKRYLKLVNVTPCTVTWKNYDGNTLKTDTVTYGTTPVYSGDTPIKEPTAQYAYTFSGWSPTPAAVTGNVEYTAQFTQSLRTFTVTWKNWDGTELEKDENVAYGAKPIYNSDTPTRKADGSTTYQFSGWSPQITDDTVITEDTTYTARFSTNTQTYTITWKDGDGNTLRTEPCIEGVTPHYTGEAPTKTADVQYTYSFNGTWDPPLVAADRDTTYVAQFDHTLNKYDVTFKNYDGTVLQSSQVEYGTVPEYTGDTPVKPSTLTKSFTFSGWDRELAAVTGEATYTATFTEKAVDTISIKVTNVVGWNSVYVYYWGAGSDNNWPGTQMTGDSDGFIFTASIPGSAEGIVFSNGASSNTKQTVNVETGIKDGAHWAILNEMDADETAKYKVHAVPTYYLVGTMTDWGMNTDYAFAPVKASTKVEEYMLTVSLNANSQIKVYGSDDSWYPEGAGGNYTVSASGTYEVRFRPNADGGSTWHQKLFYLKNITPYTITWKDGNGSTLKTDTVTHGQTPSYTGNTPTKTATDQYTYTFNGTWSPSITAATANATYTAQFDQTVNRYTIRFLNENGSLLSSYQVPYGETPVYAGDEPVKVSDEQYSYSFAGWNPVPVPVSGDADYTAVYDAVPNNASIKGHTISLKDEIGVNFYIFIPDRYDYDDLTVRFNWGTGEYKKEAIGELKAPSFRNSEANYMATCYVAARAMTDTVTMTITDGNNSEIIVDTYSVVDYADDASSMYSGEKYAGLRKLLCDMLDYGSAAQIQFKYKHEGENADLAGEYIATVDPNWVRTQAPASITDNTDFSAVTGDKYGLTFAGATLVAGSKTSVRLYFDVKDNDLSSNTVITLDGKELSLKNHSSGYKYLEISSISAKNIFDDFSLTFTSSDKTDNAVYSAANYYNIVVNGDYADSFKSVMKAMYNYSESANAVLTT